MKCYYSIIPPFHYSRLEKVEWVEGNSRYMEAIMTKDLELVKQLEKEIGTEN
jgi:hypothetical protein